MPIPTSRRDFVLLSTALAASAARSAIGDDPPTSTPASASPPLPAPGTNDITTATLAEAERVLGITFTESERGQIVRTIGDHREVIASIRKAGELPNPLAPATVFRAALPTKSAERVTRIGNPDSLDFGALPPLPTSDDDLAFASLHDLARWIRDRALTSARLTDVYLARIERFAPKLRCVITVTADLARQQAKAADDEIRRSHWRGPLHGIPYGLKDVIDTKDIKTTWGAEPWKDRVPTSDAWVTKKLADAGAVLVAKTAVGALAYGDIWHGGMCRSPWNIEKGSSGSSAGSASGVAAGLFGFAIGTETLGSIVSPSDRCGAAGLRPTFGRVGRTGAMALVWTMDKIGALCRSISDTAFVLAAINGYDVDDPSSIDERFHFDRAADASELRVGIDRNWFANNPYAKVASAALEAAKAEGCKIVEIKTPEIDPSPTILTLYAEAAASFDAMTRSNTDDQLSWQADEAWPNTFRRSHLISATDLVQADRIRRRTMEAMHDYFDAVDCVLAPPFAGGLLVHTNATGQPCAVIRGGFTDIGEPQAVTVMGRLFDEGTILRVASAIERRLGVWERRPTMA
ncbi:MAG: amidase [Phycisphaerae bacterium]|mgnify:CR=1 FL=1|nr:amidase [Phycisphaerae bacterium]